MNDKLKNVKNLAHWALQKAESKGYSKEAWETLEAYAETVDDSLWESDKEFVKELDKFEADFLSENKVTQTKVRDRFRNVITILAKDDEFLVMDILLER